MTSPFRIGIAGLGTVGAGVVDALQRNGDVITERVGRPIEIVSVTARDRAKDRGVDLAAYDWADHPLEMADNPDIDCVVELIGGETGLAKDLTMQALKNGKHVITANKALLAHHGGELSALAEERGVGLYYEAAVAGGIPIIKALREGFASNQIESVYGILNGTCNYILTEMRETGRDFADVLAEAQEKGYAEAEPSLDVDGYDAAHKLTLLTALAFGVKPDFEALHITGIRHITAEDILHATELGYKIKLLGMARRINGKIMQTLEPCLVPHDSALGSVEGVFNAVFTQGDCVDQSMLVGRGAGAGPTATAVLADIVDLARGHVLKPFGVSGSVLKTASWVAQEDILASYYLHLKVTDKPGVIADVSAILRDHAISIESLMQRGRDPDQPVSVVIMTHEIAQSVMKEAVAAIQKLPCVTAEITCVRIENI